MEKKDTIYLLVVCIICFLVWEFSTDIIKKVKFFEKDNEELIHFKNQKDSLEEVVISLKNQNLKYDFQITQLQDSLNNINNQLKNNNQKLKNLKKVYDEKISFINKFSSDDISKYISDRYKDSIQ